MYRCPFKVEPAKSGRSKCKGCNEKIPKNALRLSITTVYYRKVFTQNIHIECTDEYGLDLNDYIPENVENPRYIENWSELTPEQKQLALKCIYKMDVSVEDITNGKIGETAIAKERYRVQREESIRISNANKKTYMNCIDEMEEHLKPYGFESRSENKQNRKRKREESVDKNAPSTKKRKLNDCDSETKSNDEDNNKYKVRIKKIDIMVTNEKRHQICEFIEKNESIEVECDQCDGQGGYPMGETEMNGPYGHDECDKCDGKGKIPMNELNVASYGMGQVWF